MSSSDRPGPARTTFLSSKGGPSVPRREQLLQLNWVRGIAALLVVAYHCEITMLMPKYFGASTLPPFKAGHSGVQLFFVLSGFVVYLAHRQDPQSNSAAIFRFATKRFRRLYPALWVVCSYGIGKLAFRFCWHGDLSHYPLRLSTTRGG
ncbi:MAG: acyltransferase [Burkholderia sp.]|nr:acyltransferase [Burkholderia sp.]